MQAWVPPLAFMALCGSRRRTTLPMRRAAPTRCWWSFTVAIKASSGRWIPGTRLIGDDLIIALCNPACGPTPNRTHGTWAEWISTTFLRRRMKCSVYIRQLSASMPWTRTGLHWRDFPKVAVGGGSSLFESGQPMPGNERLARPTPRNGSVCAGPALAR